METQEKKPGNPNFAKKAPMGKYDPKKRYHFQLISSYESAKPRDYETGEMMDNPYPPIFFITNSGVAVNPDTGDQENWRYLFGYASIWVKDQTKPEPTEMNLSNPKNFIEFRNGHLFANGVNTALLDAIMIQDEYADVKFSLTNKPAVYRMVNPEKELRETRNLSDFKFEASKAAREASVEEMLPVAMHFGIDVDNPEENLERIRTQFIFRAESDPEAFNRQFTNPKIKYKYNITMALRDGIISTNEVPGKMVLTDTKKIYFDVKEGDVAEQFAQLVFARNNDAVKLYEQIQNLLPETAK